jgi:WD40 repeat protein
VRPLQAAVSAACFLDKRSQVWGGRADGTIAVVSLQHGPDGWACPGGAAEIDTLRSVLYEVVPSAQQSVVAALFKNGSAMLMRPTDAGAELLAELQGHRGPVVSAAFHPDHEHVFASGSRDNTVVLWDGGAWCC